MAEDPTCGHHRATKYFCTECEQEANDKAKDKWVAQVVEKYKEDPVMVIEHLAKEVFDLVIASRKPRFPF